MTNDKPKRTAKRNAPKLAVVPAAAPAPDKPKRTGRPPMPYDPAVGDAICKLVAEGSNLARIVAESEVPGVPSLDVIYRWLREESEAFGETYARARETRADSRSDKIDDIVRKVEAGTLDPQAARVMIDAIKWQMSKENVIRYGDRLQSDVNINDASDTVLADARRRAAAVARQSVA